MSHHHSLGQGLEYGDALSLMLWSTVFGPVSPVTLWIGHTVIAMPYVIRTTLAVYRSQGNGNHHPAPPVLHVVAG